MVERKIPQPRQKPSKRPPTRIIGKRAAIVKKPQNSKPRNSRPQKSKPRNSKLKCALGIFILISAITGASLAASFPNRPLQQLSREETATFDGESFVSSRLSLPSVTRPVNILVLGMSVLPPDVKNSSPGTQSLGYLPQVHSVDGLSDTMLLVRFNPKTNGMTLLSIPRDTRVVMEKYGVQKINAANVHGGPVLAASEVSKLLGNVEISRYARINVLAVGKLVDALGGLTIDVPKDMKYTDESQHLYINLKKGEQLLNGDQVMQFLRFRHDASGDIGRVQRQQLVMRAVIQQAINPLKLAAIPHVVEAIKSDIDSNLSVEELMGLLLFATRVDRSQVQTVVLPGNTNGNGRRSVSYWLPDRDRINQMMATYFYQGNQ